MNSAVQSEVTRRCESSAANITLKRFLSRMTQFMFHQFFVVLKTLSTFSALVFSTVNVHMWPQICLTMKTFLTLSTRIPLVFSVSSAVSCQTILLCKPLVTHSTDILRSWLVNAWLLGNIITISSSLYLKWTHCICTTHNTSFCE